MVKRPKSAASRIEADSDINLLIWLATCASVLSFLFFYRHGQVLLYGDAIAHINIARRVFDSKTPGLLQLGTVWLPLPHLLIIPFIVSTELWQRGAGGSIPSMAGYVFSVVGIFRLTRSALKRGDEAGRPTRTGAWTAALIYGANPNLLYMQSTAMGESVYLAFFIWAVVFFTESVRNRGKGLTKCALCLAAACLTRYDGWCLAAGMVLVILGLYGLSLTKGGGGSGVRVASGTAALQGRGTAFTERALAAVLKFALIAAAAPALWLAYNGIIYRNPLEFANGPYSARAIERKTQSAANPGHPGSGNPALAAMYFFKSAEDNVAQNQWLQRLWVLLGLGAIIAGFFLSRRFPEITAWPLAFLLVPLPFYALSIAYGGVPIFIPQWWPFTHYNTRYGLQLLPAFAIALAIIVYVALTSGALNRRLRLACILPIFALLVVSDSEIWQATPICLQEAESNMRTRNQLQLELARWLEKMPANSTILMYLGDQVGALERAAIPLKRTINEGNHRVWKRPSDPDGLWERALANPSQYADYVIAFDGDPVWQAVHDKHLHELVELHVTGQPRAILYSAR